MKSMVTVLTSVLESRTSRKNLRSLGKLLLVLFLLIVLYSILFHYFMLREGQDHTWITGLYWTLTVMTTLGFGDITFHTDLGRLFSIIVLATGVTFMLILLPFTFIEFFYAPWIRAQTAARAPRQLSDSIQDHVILTRYGPIAVALIPMLEKYGFPYVVLCPTVQEALELDDRNVRVAVGDLDDPETYQRLRLGQAAMLITTRTDVINTNAAFAARELSERLHIVATASSDSARDVLELAGATMVLRLEEMMGLALARRVRIRDSNAHVIGNVEGLLIAEAAAFGTPLPGQTIGQSELRERTGVSIIGVWDRGELVVVDRDTMIEPDTVFVLAGTREQLDRYDASYSAVMEKDPFALIIGGGRVGRATSLELQDLGVRTTIIEKIPDRVTEHPESVIGDATQLDVLKRAGIRDATTLIITTHDDETNVALTIFFRRLSPNWQILSRATHQRSVKTLSRAGADLVLSYASMGANTVFNLLRGSGAVLLAEGLSVFSVEISRSLAGRTLLDLRIRSRTGCTVIAVESDGKRHMNPGRDFVMPHTGKAHLVGSLEAEDEFLATFLD
ncbi:MAG: NAD-binding protein [Thermoanaerobaculia bacterium]|nr:NAD-binding protein [Thermoanaerobaculia bacterium]